MAVGLARPSWDKAHLWTTSLAGTMMNAIPQFMETINEQQVLACEPAAPASLQACEGARLHGKTVSLCGRSARVRMWRRGERF